MRFSTNGVLLINPNLAERINTKNSIRITIKNNTTKNSELATDLVKIPFAIIAPAIAMLNGIGYGTEYCRDGHYTLDIEGRYVECVDSPYIYFKFHLPKEALDIIPIDWDVDNTNEKGTIISNSELAEVIKNKNIYASEAEEFLQSARESLFSWIEKLPNLI